MQAPVLYIVVPCYNEEAVLPETGRRLHAALTGLTEQGRVSPRSRITFVDDGSKDGTWPAILALTKGNPSIEGIKLAHNVGHQRALWAGMNRVRERCDCLITIDADLQDDVEAIGRFVERYNEGCQVVYGVRSSRKTDTSFKRRSAHLYYGLMKRLGVELEFDHADYRLLGREALDALAAFPERNLFLRGMVPLLGFKQGRVYYERGERFAGESKYPLKKMLMFAMEGITSFSVKPIRCILALGALFLVLGLAMAVWAVISRCLGRTVAGWASIMVSLWVIGGAQLMALGLIGEYVGKVYTEVKRRPRYIIEEYTAKDEEQADGTQE